jgi:rSAM/selenodomain-associated transferase 2
MLSSGTVKIAVVIPALDESGEIGGAIESASAPGVEIVVVDGGSRDDTASVAGAAGARVIASDPGRALQLQAGARATTGEGVLFLHADTRLPAGWAKALCDALSDSRFSGGAFGLRFEGPEPSLRVLEWGIRIRLALFALPYGDQAIFVRRSVLEAMGGVPQAAWMEDLDLVRELKLRGRLALLPMSVTTSARRYQQAGLARTALTHGLAVLGWRLGVDRARLSRWLGR